MKGKLEGGTTDTGPPLPGGAENGRGGSSLLVEQLCCDTWPRLGGGAYLGISNHGGTFFLDEVGST